MALAIVLTVLCMLKCIENVTSFEPWSVLQQLEEQGHEFLWLPNWDHSPYSILALSPLQSFSPRGTFQWDDLRTWMGNLAGADQLPAGAGPLQGGIFGGLSYEAALHLDRVRVPRPRQLLGCQSRFSWHPVVLVHHAPTQCWTLQGALHHFPEYTQKLRAIWSCLQTVTPHDVAEPQIETLVSAEEYGNWVQSVRQAIAQGDLYQANLAHPLFLKGKGSLAPLFQRIHSHNPSPWAAYWNTPHFQLLSNSPELLLEGKQGQLRAKPIAGTRPRGSDDDADQRLRRNLIRSPKERAEHLMLVDLVRNDLGRVCEAGSVQVPLLMDREPYRNVTHIVSTVSGNLASGKDSLEALAASFPGGTITGTPKLRSMEWIDQLEAYPRGFYTGSLGWMRPHGDFAWNILIRTLQVQKGDQGNWKGYLHVGAGIVADSQPLREYQETLHKAQAWRTILANKDSYANRLA